MQNSINRFIEMQGVLNFRDMGGYKTHNGRTVKRHLFFRSANLTRMTEADKQQFKQLGIKTVFDYRDDHEAENNSSPTIEGVEFMRVPVKGTDIFTLPITNKPEEMTLDVYEQINADVFAKFYAKMLFNNPSFQRLMDIVKDERNLGLLHHCAIGKDRTGVGSALIFMLLDVPRESIMQDYLLTNGQLTPVILYLEQQLKAAYPAINLTAFYDIMTAHEKYLNAVFEEIDRRYDSTESFLFDQFGISQELRAELQAKYVE